MRHLLLLTLFVAGAPVRGGTVWFGTQARAGSEGIYVAEFDPASGRFGGVQLAAKLPDAGFQALGGDGKVMFSTCAIAGGGGVAALRVGNGGMLAEINRQPTGGKGACFVGVDRTGRCVMAANYGDGSITSLPVLADGSLGAAASFHRHAGCGPDLPRQAGPHAHAIHAGPDNRFAYAPDLGIDQVMIYQLDAAQAKLTPAGAGKLPPGSGPRHMKFGADGRFAYVLNELALTVAVFSRQVENGGLDFIEVVPVLPPDAERAGMTCSEIRLGAGGRHVYTANRDTQRRGRDSLSMLAVKDDGRLTLVQTVPAGASVPRHITLDPSGRWLLVCGQESNEVAVLGVDPADGRIGPPAGKLALGAPMCATFAAVSR
jgi:6-phosphogluconolactonase